MARTRTPGRREALLAAAQRVLTTQGVEKATIDDVTAAAGMAKGTFYLYFQSKSDLVAAMQRDSGLELAELKVDGGAAANNHLMQFQADILGTTVRRPVVAETTALGAAYLAGLAVGYWTGQDEIAHNWALDRQFAPQMRVAGAQHRPHTAVADLLPQLVAAGGRGQRRGGARTVDLRCRQVARGRSGR